MTNLESYIQDAYEAEIRYWNIMFSLIAVAGAVFLFTVILFLVSTVSILFALIANLLFPLLACFAAVKMMKMRKALEVISKAGRDKINDDLREAHESFRSHL